MPQGHLTRSQSSPRDSVAEFQYLEGKIEQNPNSPLAVRLAYHYLMAGRTSEAKMLCERAVSLYPDYPTAHLILGKCLLASGHYADAKQAFQRVLAILPDCTPAQLFVRELAPLAPDDLDGRPPSVKPAGSTQGEEKTATAATDPGAGSAIERVEGSSLKTEQAASSIESPSSQSQFTALETLAEKLRHVKRTAPDPNALASPPKDFDEHFQDIDIVSETMAEIYASQGVHDKAIRIYRQLLEEKPDQKEKFTARIQHLQERK